METDADSKQNICVFNTNPKSLEDSLKSMRSEPEFEEINQETLVKTFLKELQVEIEVNANTDPFTHENGVEKGKCIHCMLTEKLRILQDEIIKVNSEISETHQIANLKKQQNAELKNAIKRLENSLAKSNDSISIEKKEGCCSCGSSCDIV